MTIHSYFKAERSDPDWQFTPEKYFNKKFKMVDASTIQLETQLNDQVILRQTPSEYDLFAKHLTVNASSESQLDLVLINDAEPEMQQIFFYEMHVFDNAKLNIDIFIKGGKLNKHIIQIFLNDGASANLAGLVINTTGGDSEIITKILHQGHQSSSNQTVFCMSENASQTVFHSMTLVNEDADDCSVHIDNSNFILSANSRCFGKPEVFVAASGADVDYSYSTKHLDHGQINYLESKGIDEKTARKIIINGFSEQIFDYINAREYTEELRQMYL
jgi:Fe-S cluster assembly scaffold protein SufB